MKGTFIYINMTSRNVAAAREFYTKLGFDINTKFSTDENVFITIADNVQLILASEALLRQTGEQRELADTSKVTEASVVISMPNREAVDSLYDTAIAAGAKPAGVVEEPEHGLYARAFTDPDGHKIDINHMAA